MLRSAFHDRPKCQERKLAAIEDTHPHTIRDVAAMLGVTQRALRFYEGLHLISPKRISRALRLYSDGDVARLQQIMHFAHLGFSLVEVKQLLGATSEDLVVKALNRRRREVSAEIEHLQKVLCDISDAISGVRLPSRDEAG